MRKPKLLWVGDAVIKSGFAKVNHSVNEHLSKIWDIECLGIGYSGEPHSYPYPIYPAKIYGKGDMFGISRFVEICDKVDPDVVLFNTDTYAICGFLDVAKELKKRPILVAYSPIDTPAVKKEIVSRLKRDGLDLFISYTEFGAKELRKSGWQGLTSVIPHGVDNAFYRPHDRKESRQLAAPGIPAEVFLIGAMGRNQPRKRLDLSMIYFAEWLKRGGDGYLWLHCAKKDAGWDLVELAKHLGIHHRVFMPGVQSIEDMPEEVLMPIFYSMCDVQISTSLGEGWGLMIMEGMACGVPQIVPDWSALGEWARSAARVVECSSVEILSGYHTFGIGGIVDQEKFIEALDEVATSPMLRQEMTRQGLELIEEERFRWNNIARQFHFNLAGLIHARSARVKKAISPFESQLDKLVEAIAA